MQYYAFAGEILFFPQLVHVGLFGAYPGLPNGGCDIELGTYGQAAGETVVRVVEPGVLLVVAHGGIIVDGFTGQEDERVVVGLLRVHQQFARPDPVLEHAPLRPAVEGFLHVGLCRPEFPLLFAQLGIGYIEIRIFVHAHLLHQRQPGHCYRSVGQVPVLLRLRKVDLKHLQVALLHLAITFGVKLVGFLYGFI